MTDYTKLAEDALEWADEGGGEFGPSRYDLARALLACDQERQDYKQAAGAEAQLADEFNNARKEALNSCDKLYAQLLAATTKARRYRQALEYMADYKMTGTEKTLHLDFQGKARDAIAAGEE